MALLFLFHEGQTLPKSTGSVNEYRLSVSNDPTFASEIGFVWLCFSAQPAFFARKRGKLALFGALARKTGPNSELGASDFPVPDKIKDEGSRIKMAGCPQRRHDFLLVRSLFSGQKCGKLALFGTNDDTGPARAWPAALRTPRRHERSMIEDGLLLSMPIFTIYHIIRDVQRQQKSPRYPS